MTAVGTYTAQRRKPNMRSPCMARDHRAAVFSRISVAMGAEEPPPTLRLTSMSAPRFTAPPSSPHATATMKANPGRDTGPEVALRSALHHAGLRFRKDFRLAVGGVRVRPDIVFTRRRVAVFID